MPSKPPLRKIPLFPLPNVVHFPRTELRLHIFEPRYRQMLRDLLGRDQGSRWIGMVLLRPGWEDEEHDDAKVFRAGTAGRLVSVDSLPDGRSNIVLRGEYRFLIDRELADRPYRQAMVRPLRETRLDEEDPGLVSVRVELVDLLQSVAVEAGKDFPMEEDDLVELTGDVPLEELVNRVAAGLDLPILRKQELLAAGLDRRARVLRSILRQRRELLDFLRPYRRMASDPERN